MTTVELPPPSPALTVHEAAVRVRQIADRTFTAMATNSYWSVGWERGVTNAIGGDEGDLAALLTPELAVQLADWLDECASKNARTGEPIPAFALAFTKAPEPAA